MSQTIDELVVKIDAEATGAKDGITTLINTLTELNKVLGPLTSDLKAVAGTMKSVGSYAGNLNKANKEISNLADTQNKLAKSSDNVQKASKTISFAGMMASARQVGKVIANSIRLSNDYVESQNLFMVAMGDFAEEATEWSDHVSDALGIDPAEMRKNMGYFQQLSTALGVADDKAYTLSKNMTSLAYDIASFYNIDIGDSFLKLQSALVGELEPIRRLGIDISKARLQQELYALGVDASVDSITQADKAMLRYIAIMKQTTNAQGDMGKTLMSPANALRVLKSSFIQLGRAIGNVFIPILQSLLPVIQLVVKGLTYLAEKLAAFLGYENINFDWDSDKSAENFLQGIGDEADKTKKKLDNITTGFDELHVINSGSMGGDDEGLSVLGDIELPEYDILSKYTGSVVNDALPAFEAALESFYNSDGVQLVLWVIKELYEGFQSLADWALENPDIFGGVIGDGITVALFGTLALKLKELYEWGEKTGKLKMITPFVNLVTVGLLVYTTFKYLKDIFVELRTDGINTAEDVEMVFKNLSYVIMALGLVTFQPWVIAIGGVLLVASNFSAEIMLGLLNLSKFAATIVAGIVGWVVGGIGKMITWVKQLVSEFKEFFAKVDVGFEIMMTKLKKWVIDGIASMLDNEMVQNFLKFLDKIGDTNFSETLTAFLDTSDLDAKLEELETTAVNLDNYFNEEQAKLDADWEKYDNLGKTWAESTYKYMDDIATQWALDNIVNKETKEEKDNDLGDIDKVLASLKGEDSQTQLDIKANGEEQLEQLQTNADIAEIQKQLNQLTADNTAETNLKLDEANVAFKDYAETSKTDENAMISLVSNIKSLMYHVIDAINDIEINVYNVVAGGEYASGGLPSRGELFVANEAGPEFIGSIGNRTAVANSQQMVDALATGVYQGMTSALRNNTSRPINIEVPVVMPNGRELARATTQGTIDNGYDIGLGGFDV